MLFDQPGTLDPNDVLSWHALCVAGLDRERESTYACLDDGSHIPPYLANALPIGTTYEEAEQYFMACKDELDLAAVLILIAGAEGRVRLDAERRQRSGGTLAGRLKLLRNQAHKDWSLPLYDNGILDAWKDFIGELPDTSDQVKERLKGSIGGLKRVLPVRHWVAHGRYWELHGGIHQYPPVSVARAVTQLYTALKETASQGGLPVFL